MDATFKAMIDSGKRLLVDTKARRAPAGSSPGKPTMKMGLEGPTETDPYRIFSKRVISEKPKKVDVLKDIRRFIDAAEAAL